MDEQTYINLFIKRVDDHHLKTLESQAWKRKCIKLTSKTMDEVNALEQIKNGPKQQTPKFKKEKIKKKKKIAYNNR